MIMCLLALLSPGFAAEPQFDRLGIREFIEKKKITSVPEFVEQAMAAIPPNPIKHEPDPLAENGIFVENLANPLDPWKGLFDGVNEFQIYHSLSKQKASPHDPKNPRILRAGDGGKFLLAYSSLFSSIEIIQFNERVQQFEFRQIEFKSGKPEFAKHDDSKDLKCSECHAGRPNWDTYPMWPGFYGGSDGGGGDLEKRMRASFAEAKENSPTYKTVGRTNGQFLLLTNELTRLNAQRIARILNQNPKEYARYRFALAGATACLEIPVERFIPPRAGFSRFSEILADTQGRNEEYYKARGARLREESGTPPGRPNIEASETFARVRYVAQFFELKGHDRFEYWSMSLPSEGLTVEPGYYMAFQNPDHNAMEQIRYALGKTDPSLLNSNCTQLIAKSDSALKR